MKRFLKILGLAIGILLIALVALVGSVFIGRQPIVDGLEIDGARVVKDGIVSVCVLPIGEGEVALIDAGNDPSGKAILAELSRRGLGPDAVKAILITHGHHDHIAAAPLFPKAQIMALAAEVDLVEGRAGAHGPATRLFPVRPTGVKVSRALADAETVSLGSVPVKVFAMPGHTAGSAAYLANGVLFLGDSADASGGRVIGAPWLFSDDTAQNRASLVHLGQVLGQGSAEVKALVFSHSGALSQGLTPLVAFAQK